MKKLPVLLLSLVLCASLLSPAALADGAPTFTFALSCGGAHTVTAACGDIIEVAFTITRTDADAAYYSNALQNYIVFDETCFEFVDASCTRSMGYSGLKNTLAGQKIYMTDMMDSLPSSLVFGTFRLRVIGASGEGWVRCGDTKLLGRNSVAAELTCRDLCVRIILSPRITACSSDSAAASVRYTGEGTLSAAAILAAYDESGRLLALDLYSGELAAGESADLQVAAPGIAAAKLFVLDGDSGSPLCGAPARTADG